MASSSSSPGWSSQTDGTFTRPFDTLETFFKLLADGGAPINREHWVITIALRLKFPETIEDPLPSLRHAWLMLARLHPNLAGTAQADNSSNKQVLTVSPLDAESWMAETFIRHDDIPDSKALFASLRPSPTARCHWLQTSKEFCISSSHWRIDGIGMLMLANSFMKILTATLHGTNFDSDGQNPLTPSLDAIVSSYTDEETTPLYLRSAADAIVADFVRGFPSIALPTMPGSQSATPGPTEREAFSFNVATTQAIVSACKERGLSVPSAVHAAIVRVTTAYPQHPLAKSYAAFFPTDLRRHFPDPWNKDTFAIGMFCSGLPATVTDVIGKSFDDIAKVLNEAYRRDLAQVCTDDDGNPVGMLHLTAPYIRRTTKLFNTPPPSELPPVENPDLSSFGKIEQYLQHEYVYEQGDKGKVIVDDFWIGTETLARSLQCHVWTFRDQLTIQGCFNTSFYDRSFVSEVLQKVKHELVIGLGL